MERTVYSRGYSHLSRGRLGFHELLQSSNLSLRTAKNTQTRQCLVLPPLRITTYPNERLKSGTPLEKSSWHAPVRRNVVSLAAESDAHRRLFVGGLPELAASCTLGRPREMLYPKLTTRFMASERELQRLWIVARLRGGGGVARQARHCKVLPTYRVAKPPRPFGSSLGNCRALSPHLPSSPCSPEHVASRRCGLQLCVS